MLKRYCVVTGSRADYGLLYPLMRRIQNATDMELQVAITGMHLAPEFGLTANQVERDGFPISARIESLVSSDTPVGIAKSVGVGVLGFADAFSHLTPDMVIVLGDRYEILAAVQAALFAKIPVAHLAGGDLTEGVIDDSIRHAITKMSHLHFATNTAAAKRLIQLGENPSHVFVVGSTGIDYINQVSLLSCSEIESQLGFSLRQRNLLVTFHPPTLDDHPAPEQMTNLLRALSHFDADTGLIFTHSNADVGGRQLTAMIGAFVAEHRNAVAFASLGQVRYLSLMALIDVVVGNSSSGLYEAPSLKKPTVNIGDRQQGRVKAASVVDCAAETEAIVKAIQTAFCLNCDSVENPYGKGDAAQRIVEILRSLPAPGNLVRKSFHEI